MTNSSPAASNPQKLDEILSAMGLVPFSEDRLRRAELALAAVATDMAILIEGLIMQRNRLEQIERAVGELRRERSAA